MKIYLVGGAVRDKLLGLPIKEKDWVVVGATVQEMLNKGYRQVGKEFPVFLHPKTKEEYALARVERKVEPGYKGFIFNTSKDVSLEDDLKRRDLTINAMAETLAGELIDPYHGQNDLKNKILRHISSAFMEDPVRILRVGRFLSRYGYLGFQVAPETIALMGQMVNAGEVDALVAERVWKELERAMSEKNPEYFFETLDKCGALKKLFPRLNIQGDGMKALKKSTQLSSDPKIRFAGLWHNLPDPKKTISELCQRYRIPNAYRELAILTALHYASACKAQTLTEEQLLNLFYALDIFRKPKRFKEFLTTCQAIAEANEIQFRSEILTECAKAAKSIDVQKLIDHGLSGLDLAKALKQKRQEAIKVCLKKIARL